ncbi:hypothetical protein [uncultured Jannaschia sp.]|uniref:hypothetical protein n=1 Tax=uncultured Jannaschia sp. TaxID=293347 RepID=UPI002632BF2B|nr:hypothetical protein [uncultured Jannaschia sp.]
MRDAALHDAILAAHAAGDGAALVDLYGAAAARVPPDAAPFFLTQAWVHALEAAHPAEGALADRLRAMDRL